MNKVKAILLVGAGLLQKPAIEIAHEMGYVVLATDRNAQADCAGLVDQLIQIDTRDYDTHWRLGRDLKMSHIYDVRGVFTQGASVELSVAMAAESLNLPGIAVETAHKISNKVAMRECLGRAGIAQPRWYATTDYNSACAWVGELDCGFVIKPVDSSASRGFRRYSLQDVISQQDFAECASFSTTHEVLIEEALEPWVRPETPEQSLETLWLHGRCHWLNWVDRPFNYENGYAIEIGHFNPALQMPEIQRESERLASRCGEALGLYDGILKFDLMQTAQGTRVLETTARLSGGFDAQFTSPLAHGVNYIRGAMKIALIDQNFDWTDFIPKMHRHACAIAKFPKESGIVKLVTGVEEARKVAGVEEVFVRVKPGDLVHSQLHHCAERAAFVIASGNTRGETVESASTALRHIQIEVQQ